MYAKYDRHLQDVKDAERERKTLRPALRNFMRKNNTLKEKSNGFKRMKLCRSALEAIDRGGWERSFHQRQFHDQFLRACSRVFWKTEPHGEFARCHQAILEINGWEHLAQEILVSTPRRFGKTISVSMFAAAMIFSAPSVEVSIYSTCKRISQKLLRNIAKFLDVIYRVLNIEPYKIDRANMEEIVLIGPESATDMRIVNSYPSKVRAPVCVALLCCYVRLVCDVVVDEMGSVVFVGMQTTINEEKKNTKSIQLLYRSSRLVGQTRVIEVPSHERGAMCLWFRLLRVEKKVVVLAVALEKGLW